jgi:hypothetical protein
MDMPIQPVGVTTPAEDQAVAGLLLVLRAQIALLERQIAELQGLQLHTALPAGHA